MIEIINESPVIVDRNTAREQGLKKYCTGEPCKRGHIAERFVSNGGCVVCLQDQQRAWHINNKDAAQIRQRAYYEKNKDTIQAYNRVYRQENKDAIRVTIRAWEKVNREYINARQREKYAANPEHARAVGRAWRAANLEHARAVENARVAANREKDRAIRRAWVAANSERNRARISAWEKANPDKVKANHHNRQARKRGNGGTHTAADLKLLWQKQNGHCAYCLIELDDKNKSLDHIVALSRGGTNDPSNLAWACRDCNLRKNDRTLADFLADRIGV